MKFQETESTTTIPTKIVGPIKIVYENQIEYVKIPLATFETPLWYSTHRGSLVSQKTDGIFTKVIDDAMTRSIILEANNLQNAILCKQWIESNIKFIANGVEKTSRYAKFVDIHIEVIGRIIYLRISMHTGNAAGHNMLTKAADEVVNIIIANCSNIKYISISGNICVDKKNSAINGILGRGKRVVAEIIVPKSVCELILKTTPEKIVELNTKKNLVGSVLAGSVRSANAHYANVILAIYLATGQDGANVVEGSQGITFAETVGDDLYFSVTIPSLIVGVVGNGKQLKFAKQNLALMNCCANDPKASERLSSIIASAVLCSELSLMAAQTNQGELMRSHIMLERSELCVSE